MRDLLPDSSVVQGVRKVISAESIAEGQPARAADALLVVTQLAATIPPPSLRPDALSGLRSRSKWNLDY